MGGGDAIAQANNSGVDAGTDSSVTINILCLSGSKFSLQVNLDSTVEFFKSILVQHTNILAEQQRLIYQGRILNDKQTLERYGTLIIGFFCFYFFMWEMINCWCLDNIFGNFDLNLIAKQ